MSWSKFTIPSNTDKFYLEKVRLDSGGYSMKGEPGGAGRYFGHGAPVYRFTDENSSRVGYVRGFTREEAKAAVREQYPDARFYS